MEMAYTPIMKTPLFDNIGQVDLSQLLLCLGAKTAHIAKGGYALRAGNTPDAVGIVLSGQLQVNREDNAGGRALLTLLNPGDYYGETLVCAGVMQSPVNVLANQPTDVLILPFQRIITSCANICPFHVTLIKNMIGLIAQKNLMLQRRLEVLEKKTIRERVLCYLHLQQEVLGEPFNIPFNRNELAEYLAVDRSALSRALSQLERQGTLSFDKNQFTLFYRPD